MKAQRPILVTFIGDLNLIGAFLVILSFFLTPKLIEQFGILVIPISNFLDGAIRILVFISLLTISYGYFKLKRWGYWAMITYNSFFLIVAMIFILTPIKNLYNTQGFIQSLLGLIITFPSKRYFIKENEPS